MNKKAAALAVGALFAVPAAHAQITFGNDTIGTVQFYGKLYPQVTHESFSGASDAGDTPATLQGTAFSGENPHSRTSVDSNNSYLGFRGERKFGATGLKAIWQIEQAINIDTGQDSTFSNRNSFLGLAGGFGTVKLGNMDTIYKEFGAVVGMFGITSGNWISPSEVLSKNPYNEGGSFHLRQKNSIQYLTPEFGGFQGGVQYSPDESQTDTKNKNLWSFGVKYEAGPLYVALAHEIHKDTFAASDGTPFAKGTSSKDHATRLSATYELGKHTLEADIAQLKWTESGGVVDEYKHIAWDVGVESKWGGPWRTAINYTQAQDGSCKIAIGDCSTEGLKGQLIAVGVAYDLDKSTFLFGLAGKLINGKSSIYNNSPVDVDINPGTDITTFSLGMAYKF